MPERVLITGVTGFVGRHLCQHLLEAGDEVLGTAEAPPPDQPSWGALPEGERILLWDLGQSDSISSEIQAVIAEFRPTLIFHLAAISLPELCGSEEPTPQAYQVNVLGTQKVLDLACQLAPQPRVVFISTSHVYTVPQTGITFVAEDYAVLPRNGYGKSKLLAENLVMQAFSQRRLPTLIVRAFPHTGPGQSEKMMLPAWAAQFARGVSPVVVQTLQATIDLCDVRDVVRAYRLLGLRGEPGEVYHVGSGIPRTSGEVFTLLRNMVDPGRPVVESRPGVKYDPIANISKLCRATGWRPEIPIEQTVADTFAWWKQKEAPGG